jgi:hypothetical protein
MAPLTRSSNHQLFAQGHQALLCFGDPPGFAFEHSLEHSNDKSLAEAGALDRRTVEELGIATLPSPHDLGVRADWLISLADTPKNRPGSSVRVQ